MKLLNFPIQIATVIVHKIRNYSSGVAVLGLLVLCGLILALAGVRSPSTAASLALPRRSATPKPSKLPSRDRLLTVNKIATENGLPGSPASEWDIAGAGDANIQGFATDISVNHGETVNFKIDTDSTDYRLDIYRMGYYGGMGARKIATIQPSAALPQAQPACITDPVTGLIDCGNWSVSASWAVPADAVSGIYFAKLVREDATPGESHIMFIVRDDEGGSDLLFQTSDTTWQAYNRYGGNSLYTGSGPGTGGSSDGRAYKVSYNRPFTTRATTPEDWVFNAEYPMVRWLERNGYDVSYTTGVDSDRRGSDLLEHKVFISIGHDEYWSADQRANVTAARDAGVQLAFFSGNESFWKTRWENSIDGSGTSHRTLVCYKETHENAKIDPTPEWTGTWRDPRFSPPADGGRPENALSGSIFMVNSGTTDITVTSDDGKMRFWRNTSVASLPSESIATLGSETLGYEWDEDLDNGFRPAGVVRLSSTTLNGAQILTDYGSTYGSGSADHHMTLYRKKNSGAPDALVFGAGTVQWSWGLDSSHDRGSAVADARMQQATVNLFADMGVQPSTLQSGLVAASASTDAASPSSTISQPADGSTSPVNQPITITGTASDTGGGVVGGVEVSVDGGTTWHPATGRQTWSYTWTPISQGTGNIKTRAVDDSANLETPGTGISITVGPPALPVCPCTIFNSAVTGNGQTDPVAVELGVKFRSDSDGFISGIRFYKTAANTGPHTGSLWTTAGTLLGTVTFAGETASGWQEADFSAPIAITPGTTYVASYHTASGNYATGSPFNSAVDNPPLHALADGVDGPNGVYWYGSGGVYPTDTFNASNYLVDAVFVTTVAPDTMPPTVTGRTPATNALNVATGSNVSVTFSESLDPVTVGPSTIELRDSSNNLVPSAVTYDGPSRTAILDPSALLATSATYTATVKGSVGGVKDVAGNALDADVSWSFTTAGLPPDQGPGGPILVVSSTSDPFSKYYAEILRAEGLNEFSVADISSVDAAALANYQVVIVGAMPLSAAQASMFSNWVNAGGDLIAMRPDANLAGLLGLTPAGTTLSNGYLSINTGAAPGAGLVSQTIQFHGTADNYALNGATSIATLYSDASTATTSPAVTIRSVGSSGGHAAAFTYDLARSIVYTRQGNPAWAGDERDGTTPIRSDDLFFGAKSGDVQPDWVDLNKVAIPQADEQQRLLANLIISLNLDKMPLPRFWYFPKALKAVVVMTGDDHGNGGTSGRFDTFEADSTPGCSVDDWECIRSTSFVYPGTSISDPTGYEAAGFEIGLHVNSGCSDFTPASLEANFSDQLASWSEAYPGLTAPVTNRTHCITWSDWASEPKVALSHGIRLDTNYYYWPASWIQDRPGLFTGSGMPMRFADNDGTMIDVYQAATQMTDESGQTIPTHIEALLTKALGAEGYYGAFTANMHTDSADSDGANAIVASAKAHGIPVVSARQMLTWLDGRNSSSFNAPAWDGHTLTFSITAGAGARNLETMVPTASAVGPLTGITFNGSPISYTTQTIKGIQYAFFPSSSGSYAATYAIDLTPPSIVDRSPASGATDVSTNTNVTVHFSEAMDPTTITSQTIRLRANNGGSDIPANVTYADSVATLDPAFALQPLTLYEVTVASTVKDASGNPMGADDTWSFTTGPNAFTDTTVSDFMAGMSDGNVYIGSIGDGDLELMPAIGEEFSGNAFPAGWTASAWTAGGSANVDGGQMVVDGALAKTDSAFGPGRAIEFVATFGPATFQHGGFANDFNDNLWAIFSTNNTTDTLFARVNNGGTSVDVPIPGSWIGSPHRYRIEWKTASLDFYIDGVLVHSESVSVTSSMAAAFSEFNSGGGSLSVDWVRLTPVSSTGIFTSRVLDAGVAAHWMSLSDAAILPAGTAVGFETRTGNSPTPDGSWSSWQAVTGGSINSPTGRYLQYRATLSASSDMVGPEIDGVTVSYSGVLGTTAAPVDLSGRVLAANGRPILSARVTVVDQHGVTRTALTNAFGYYRVSALAAGETYVVNATAKGHTFSPRVLSLDDAIDDLDLIADQ